MAERFVINLRGGGGSGKTTLARALLAHKTDEFEWDFEKRESPKAAPKPAKWTVTRCAVPGVKLPIYVQGSYRQAQGGCDTCKEMDATERMIWKAASELTDGHVFFEGKFVSTICERWAIFSNRFNKLGLGTYLWIFLPMSKEEMTKRVMLRNGGRPIIAEHVERDVQGIKKSRTVAKGLYSIEESRRRVVDLDPLQPPDVVYDAFIAALAAREVGYV